MLHGCLHKPIAHTSFASIDSSDQFQSVSYQQWLGLAAEPQGDRSFLAPLLPWLKLLHGEESSH